MNVLHKHTFSILGASMLLLLTSGCDNQTQYGIQRPDSSSAPGIISDITADNSVPGQITLKWKNEMTEGQETLYTKVSYFDPYQNKEIIKLVSTAAKELIIKGVYVAGGDYVFTLTPVNATQTEGKPETISVRTTPIMPVVTSEVTPLKLTVDNVSTNAQESSEGPIEDSIDGNLNTFFHSDWHGVFPTPHTFTVYHPGMGKIARLYLLPRQGGHTQDVPKDSQVEFSADGKNWSKPALYHFPKPADDKSKTYLTIDGNVEETETYKKEDLILPEGTKYIRFNNLTTHGGSKSWFNFSEIGVESIRYIVFDAEAEAKKVIDAHKAL